MLMTANIIGSDQICENRRNALNDEVETLRSQLEVTERLKRKTEEDSVETVNRIAELTNQINTLTTERRKLEGQVSVLQGDLEDAAGAKEVSQRMLLSSEKIRYCTMPHLDNRT